MATFQEKQMYRELVNVTSANIKFVQRRAAEKNLGERDWYVIAIPDSMSALSKNKADKLVITHFAAQAVYGIFEKVSEILAQYQSNFRHNFQLVSEVDYLSAVYYRSHAFMSEFSDHMEEDGEEE